ncbi:MAG TPA: VOC family protein [Caldisericia bacterium]|jgi:catechol 2,3-dioxygenase-like lactoylglutathione lyase family enzyme|nr:MAG: Glyoxalase-like domain protein [bacterium ADurb.Bin132]HNW32315.1 VOC family protein [Caldisericia bacterium]HNY61634.1 VOC family protein [Caldisericia bacterium]HOC79485.1 VOC family protein [Caldisericia bacterium]HOG70635.1 VOC family protein [Caldisericia bacterium]
MPDFVEKCRAYGVTRIEVSKVAESAADWEKLWREPEFGFPFKWGSCWKQCCEYFVSDFEAEVGFFTDILGCVCNALDQDYAMFTSPARDFFIAFYRAEPDRATPPGTMKIAFMVEEVDQTVKKLKDRGVEFIDDPQSVAEGSPLAKASFATPNMIECALWGFPGG